MTVATIEIGLPDEAATAKLGEDLAAAVRRGDLFALEGDLGAGKTTLARAFIRAIADAPDLEVPSPTFTIVQRYEARQTVHHYDLYRITTPDELDELGLDEAVSEGVVLVEWPDRAGSRLPAEHVNVRLEEAGNGRRATISGDAAMMARIDRSLDIRRFLSQAGWAEARRSYLLGDASARAYENVRQNGERRILMNAPAMPDGPPIRDGKPYSRIAHLAENVTPFVAIAGALRRQGFAAPQVHANDLERGLLLIEWLGDEGIVDGNGAPVADRYIASAELLAAIHARSWPAKTDLDGNAFHVVPPYDRDALAIETELAVDWYLPHRGNASAADALRRRYVPLWAGLIERLLAGAEKSIVLRDYHSPNIIWRDGREGSDRIGLIDFQDALIGPSAYDVASLALDARVTIPRDLESRMVEAYCAARSAAGVFDRAAFEEAYAITAAQRNSKILGIFVRLDVRDGKPHYLRHLPRIRDYLARALEHPVLAPLRSLYLEAGFIDG